VPPDADETSRPAAVLREACPGGSAAAFPRVSIALPNGELFRLVADSLAVELTSRGHAVRVAPDGDPAALNCDLLVLLRMGSVFPRLTAQLQAAAQRPFTLLWQHEPLPPPETTASAHRLGLRLADPGWEDLLGSWAATLNRLGRPSGLVRQAIERRWSPTLERGMMPGIPPPGLHGLRTLFRQVQWMLNYARGPRRLVDAVACSLPTRVDYLAQQGVEALFVPVGYHPCWGEDLGITRDIDVLFLGRKQVDRRRRALDRVGAELRRRGCRIVAPEGYCGGAERTRLVSRSRVVLNLLNFPWEFPGMRLLFSLGCGAVVVTERCATTDPWREGTHFLAAPLEGLAECVADCLADEERRRAFAARARRDMLAQQTMSRTTERLLELAMAARTHRSAPPRAA
jgi:hypothetical protein